MEGIMWMVLVSVWDPSSQKSVSEMNGNTYPSVETCFELGRDVSKIQGLSLARRSGLDPKGAVIRFACIPSSLAKPSGSD